MIVRILHIEDDDDFCKIFRETMGRYRVEITQFESIVAANKFNGSIDLILLDCQPLSNSKDGFGHELGNFLDRFHGADIFLYCGLPYLIRDTANEVGEILGRSIPYGGPKEAIECAKEMCDLHKTKCRDNRHRPHRPDGLLKDGLMERDQYNALVQATDTPEVFPEYGDRFTWLSVDVPRWTGRRRPGDD